MGRDQEDAVMSWIAELANDSQAGDVRGIAIVADSYKQLCDSQRLMLEAMVNTLGTIREMCTVLIDIYDRLEKEQQENE